MRYAILIVAIVLAAGCATTTAQKLNIANEVTGGLMKRAHPMFKEKSSAAIAICKASKVKPPERFNDLNAWAETCPGFKKFWNAHKHTTDLANGIHIGVQAGTLAVTLGKKSEADKILDKVLSGVVRLKDSLRKAGFLKSIGL